MDGYSVTEAASVLGVPTERVWELLARGILAGTPEGETGMRVFLQPRPGSPPADPLRERGHNGNGGTREQPAEFSPFRELLTEFRSLTERYGQALLALGEARGEVASLRSRVDLLEARFDLRLPTARSSPWPPAPMPTLPADRATDRTDLDIEPVLTEEPPRRRRHRSGRPDVADIAEALARADDPSRAELPEAHPGPVATAASLDEPEGVVLEPEAVAADVEPEPVVAVEAAPEPEHEAAVAEPEPVVAETDREPAVAEAEPEPEAVVAEPEPGPVVAAAQPESVAEAEPEPETVAVEPEETPELVAEAELEPEPAVAETPRTDELAEPAESADETAADIAEGAGGEAEAQPEPEAVAEEPEESPEVVGETAATADETAADIAEAAQGEAEHIPPEETLQADGDWPAVAPTIDVGEADADVLAGTRMPGEEPGAAPDTGVAAVSPAADDVAARSAPITEEEATVAAEVEPPFADAVAASLDAGRPPGEEEPGAPPEQERAWESETGQWPAEAPRVEAEVEAAPEATVDEEPSVADDSQPEPGPSTSAYEAAVEEPDWFSEEDIGGPVAGEPYEPWGTAEPAGTPPRHSWEIWETEPAAPATEDEASDADRAAAEASAESEAAARRETLEPSPSAEDAGEAAVQAAEPQPAEAAEPAQPREEQVLWLGEPPAEDPDQGEGDDPASEMEIAATGWHPAQEEATGPLRRDWRAVELPGARELDDALAALRGRAGASEHVQAATPPAQPVPDDPTTRAPDEASPAQRAYARLRRILPR